MGPSSGWTRAVSCLAATVAFLPGTLAREEYYSERVACPVACSSTTSPSQWTLYTSLQRLTYCHEPMLFDVSLSGDGPQHRSDIARVRACTASDNDEVDEVIVNAILPDPEEFADETGNVKRSVTCGESTTNSTRAEFITWGKRSSSTQDQALRALDELKRWVSARDGCHESPEISFAYSNGTVLGYFGGRRVDGKAAAASLIGSVSDTIAKDGAPSRVLLQHCNASGRNETTITSAVTAGVVVDTEGSFVAVQRMVRAWSHGDCVEDVDGTREKQDISLDFFPTVQSSDPPESFSFAPTEGELNTRQSQCRIIRVEQGDGCGSLATRCGITGANYMRFNPQTGHCSSLAEGQPVCCSAGGLPPAPSQNSDGTCFTYSIKPGDGCAAIAATHSLKLQDIFDFNKNTWGWSGCEPLGQGISICLSSGRPPMPAPVDNAVCGPTKPGSRPPRGDQQLSDLNPCPLRACCNIWGQCGTTADFCIETESETGAPGTAAKGTHGCVQNCGMDVVNNGQAPSKFYKLGYFEGWNMDRPCLHMDARATKNHKQEYTDVHFSFAHITSNYEVLIPDEVKDQWEKFLTIRDGPRKTIAFGGWAFSAEPPTYHLFREATAPANRERFAQNCVDFAVKHGLDGLDFDWEYPGAPDIPGIPAGGEDEGMNYLEFLKLVKAKKPSDMTLSIAAPASFWYLKQFPIASMHQYLDYIVYMTYDLHGQWDAGNEWSNPSCPSGSCLRSHVNWTETHNSLAMVTKAGVPAHKILMGVSTYGRSFKMAQAGCDGPMCTFLGDRLNSQAKPGRCTGTGGYLANAEIFEQISKGVTRQWTDTTTRANYLVYEGTEWVSYMDNTMRDWREQQASRLNLGGTIEWAIDLQDFLDDYDGDGDGNGDGDGDDDSDSSVSRDLWKAPEACKDSPPHDTIKALEEDKSIPAYCLPFYCLELLEDRAQKAVVRFKELMDGDYDRNFGAFRKAIHRSGGDRMEAWVLENAEKWFDCTRGRTGTGAKTDCPPSWDVEGVLASGNVTFTIKDGEEDNFYDAIMEDVGLTKQQVRFGRYNWKRFPVGEPEKSCSALSTERCVNNYFYGFPMVEYAYFKESDVPNPKDYLEPAVGSAGALPATLWGYRWGAKLGLIQEDLTDVVNALTNPVLLVEESLENMIEVDKVGSEVREQEMQNLILTIVQTVLFIIPFVGKIAGSFTATFGLWIRAGANIVGDLGLIGTDIYKITQAETADERAVLGLGIAITGLGTLTNIPGIREAARLRKSISATTARKISKSEDGVITFRAMERTQDTCYMMSGALPASRRDVGAEFSPRVPWTFEEAVTPRF